MGSMHSGGRYKQVLLIADTCQAASLFSKVTAPNVFGIGSSSTGVHCMMRENFTLLESLLAGTGKYAPCFYTTVIKLADANA